RDPKTRKISKADFRDRVIHHALCNIIEPLFDKTFIHDSYANRKDKGTLEQYKKDYQEGKITYNIIYKYLQGWLAYAKQANTHKLRKKVVEAIEKEFPDEIATLEINKLLKIDHANKAATKRV
ncbi:MAG TPA: hypothetical protein VJH37_00150, partial [Candidatus Nanoarchaeia archaeon]|nr:hypothetical protein [Candidatus Nanoarchaeia archaeon]